MNPINPLKKQAQMAVLQGMLNKPTADAITSVGPLATIGKKAKGIAKATSDAAPLTTGKGIKESLSKKIKPSF